MRRIVLIVPNLLGDPDAESPLRQNLPALQLLTELGELRKLTPTPKVETPEALYLGMRPDEAQLRQGPLTVSALGADPPDRSTHFHLSLMAFQEGEVRDPAYRPTREELDTIFGLVKRLDTPTLTLLRGEALDHGLVWEALGDLGTTSASEAAGKPMRGQLPEGDGENVLRRLIDDSINLLAETELNLRRMDDGLPPLNLLWPWGQGVRRPVPNLMLRRGERAHVESGSMRLSGLARLAGYKHEDRDTFGRGLNTRLRALAERALKRDITISLITAMDDLAAPAREEERHWFVRELDRELLQPLLDSALVTATRISILAPGAGTGLALRVVPKSPAANHLPFDERSLEERHVPTIDLHQTVDEGVTL